VAFPQALQLLGPEEPSANRFGVGLVEDLPLGGGERRTPQGRIGGGHCFT
jgi:hypothetical protein